MGGLARGLVASATSIAVLAALAVPAQAGFLTGYVGDPRFPSGIAVEYADSFRGLGITVEVNQRNALTVNLGPDRRTLWLKDLGQTVIPRPDPSAPDFLGRCTYGIATASCRLPPGSTFTFVSLYLGGRDDALFTSAPSVDAGLTVDAGTGADTIGLGAGDDTIYGGPGDDRIATGPGADDIDLGGDPHLKAGNDLIDPGTGRDTVNAPEDGDRVTARDGESDRIVCFSQAAVSADPIDELFGCPNADVG